MKLPSPIQLKPSRIVIIPLIDVMFFLLASFMMVSLQMENAGNIKVNIPPASLGRTDFKPDMLNIAVDKAGRIWLAKRQVSFTELTAILKARSRTDKDVPVYISGDRATLNRDMTGVLQLVRAAGVQRVAFMVSDNGEVTHP